MKARLEKTRLEEVELAIAEADRDKERAACSLGISRAQLYRILKASAKNSPDRLSRNIP